MTCHIGGRFKYLSKCLKPYSNPRQGVKGMATAEKKPARMTASKKVPAKSAQEKRFDYCVARPWSDSNPDLCVYAFHGEIQHGTMSDARNFLQYVRRQAENQEEKKEYAIYKVAFTKV